MVEPNQKIEKEVGLCVKSAIVELDKENKVSLGVLNVLPYKVTKHKHTSTARITILTAKQADYLQPVDTALLTNYSSETVYSLTSDYKIPGYTSTKHYLFPTPDNYSNPVRLTGLQPRIYDELVKIKSQEKTDPISSEQDRTNFLAQFTWKNSVFNKEQNQTVEKLLVKYHHIFARH